MQKKKGEIISGRTTLPTVKYGGVNMNIWGCMSRNGVGMLSAMTRLYRLKGVMLSNEIVGV